MQKIYQMTLIGPKETLLNVRFFHSVIPARFYAFADY